MQKIFIAIITLLFVIPQPAHAYIDPGTGSVILQAVIGLFFAGAVTIKMFWQKIISFFKRSKSSE